MGLGCTSCSVPSRLELLVHALSGESTCTSTGSGNRNVSNHPRCLHGTASATAGSMGCVLERDFLSSLPCGAQLRPPLAPRRAVPQRRATSTQAKCVTSCDHVYGLWQLQRARGGKKCQIPLGLTFTAHHCCFQAVSVSMINRTVISTKNTRGSRRRRLGGRAREADACVARIEDSKVLGEEDVAHDPQRSGGRRHVHRRDAEQAGGLAEGLHLEDIVLGL